MSQIVSGSVIGVYVCSTEETCCLCDKRIAVGEHVKQIGREWSCLPCVDRGLKWLLQKREAKKMPPRATVDA